MGRDAGRERDIRTHIDDATLVAVVYDDGGERRVAETEEPQRFRDFLPTKNGCMVFGLVGHDNSGETGDSGNLERRWLPYTAARARRDALAARGETGQGEGSDAGEQARIEAFGILVDELAAIREAAASGNTSVDAKPEHATSGSWPCVRQMLELLGFSVRNVTNSRMERQGATIFWDEA